MLGRTFANEIHRAGAPPVNMPNRSELDVTNELAVRRYITQVKPSVIINCSVLRNVDLCETDPNLAYRVNTQSVEYIAKAAKSLKRNPRIIHISTDYVFDGNKVFDGSRESTYSEKDETNPVQVYGKSKLDAEKFVLDANGYVYRVQWLFGPTRDNFIDWIAKSVLEKKTIPVSLDQVGSPSSTAFVAQLILVAFNRSLPGLYHVSHDNFCTRHECARYIASILKQDPDLYFKKMIGANFGVATRPLNTCLDSSKLKKAMDANSLGSWQADVLAYISTRYAEHL